VAEKIGTFLARAWSYACLLFENFSASHKKDELFMRREDARQAKTTDIHVNKTVFLSYVTNKDFA